MVKISSICITSAVILLAPVLASEDRKMRIDRVGKQHPEAVYGGIYTPDPTQNQSIREWSLSRKGELLKDYPISVRGSLLTVLGGTLSEESKMILIETGNGQRRAIPFFLLSPGDCEYALNAYQSINPLPEYEKQSSYQAAWKRYSPQKDQERVRSFESDHFIFFYGTKKSEESTLLRDTSFVQGIKDECEAIWDFYENRMHVPMPFADVEAPIKVAVYFYGTGLPKLRDKAARVEDLSVFMYPRQFKGDIPIFAHEFVHVIQAVSGGFRRDAHHGNFREAHADWLSLQWNQTKGGKAILDSTRFSDFPLFSWQVAYGYWPLLQHFSETYSPSLCVDVWSENERDSRGNTRESPLESLWRIGSERGYWEGDDGWSDFADVLAMAAARKAYWDFIPQASYLWRLRERGGENVLNFTRKQPLREKGYWTSKAERSPASFGYHTIELTPTNGRITVNVEERDDCDWRIVLVARDAQWNCRYSEIGKSSENVGFDVEPEDRAFSLVVLAVPHEYEAHTRKEEESNKFSRYPFKLTLTGAEPGFPEN